MKAQFECKPDFHFREFVIEKTVTVPDDKLEEMLCHPLWDQRIIAANAGFMMTDGEGVRHCLLVMGEHRTDGLLIESEGCAYARYASYVPDAVPMRYPALMEMNHKLAEAAALIVSEGIRHTASGKWSLSFGELERETGLCVDDKPFLQETLGDMLRSRPEVTDLVIDDGRFEVELLPELCPNFIGKEETFPMPDQISMEEMYRYGYTWNGMLPLGKEAALRLDSEGMEVFILTPDDAEHAAENRAELECHEGLFGIERRDWQMYQERIKGEQEPKMSQTM